MLVAVTALSDASSAAPIYNINPLTLPGPDSESIGIGISSSGVYTTGWQKETNAELGFIRTQAGGTIELPALDTESHPYQTPSAVNNNGVVVGTALESEISVTGLPVIWEDVGSVAQLPVPAGFGSGNVYAINDSGLAVGRSGKGTDPLLRATTFTTTEAIILPQTTPDGVLLSSAYDINNGGQIVGEANSSDDGSLARAFSLTPGSQYATDLGTLPGHESATAYGVSENGYVVGRSTTAGGTRTPFIWSVTSGMVEIPKINQESGTAVAVNSDGWVTGDLTGISSVPFLYDGNATHLLNDLIPTDSGWNLAEGYGNTARDISEDGTITGQGNYHGKRTGFVMTLVPEPNLTVLLFGALSSCLWIRRR